MENTANETYTYIHIHIYMFSHNCMHIRIGQSEN